jgi:hypothetical protein
MKCNTGNTDNTGNTEQRTIIPITFSTEEPSSTRNDKNRNRGGNKVKLTFITVATVVLLALSILGVMLFLKNDPNIIINNITQITIASSNHTISCPGFNVQITATGVNVICPPGYTTDRGSYGINTAASCPAANNYKFCNRCISTIVNHSYVPPLSWGVAQDSAPFRTKHFTLKGWHETIHYACWNIVATKLCIVEPRELPVTCQ